MSGKPFYPFMEYGFDFNFDDYELIPAQKARLGYCLREKGYSFKKIADLLKSEPSLVKKQVQFFTDEINSLKYPFSEYDDYQNLIMCLEVQEKIKK